MTVSEESPAVAEPVYDKASDEAAHYAGEACEKIAADLRMGPRMNL